ncbi:branched-chain alpha-keto acid dehydrogenase subunit E2 [Brachybacterium vulturis]|uniref:Dihydrolipoamide acetyltransferase component of pyruvate dehydrogenase complex n=1 Tax=Brachybacterium vulturis TaxID=2017484 RepID=A0A291GJW2_9MICO|nr:dihydrolipoamide acetyltransferase family protein [Brachybacterium vulturis]ATG50501.1 branched-chain alpha-keto acid dehydrogenase subunit E2 [Brachybacterium vulturis]
MTIRTFALPDLGEGLTEAEIVQWLVAAGDTVAVDQPIVEVETAKAAVEVPCPFAGTVTTLHAEADTALAVGAPLISVEDGIGAAPTGADAGGEDGADEEASVGAADEGSGQVLVGYGTTTASSRRRRRPRERDGAEVAETAPEAAETAPAVAPEDPPAQAPRVINPLVRRLAREQGVDLTAVRGTGPTGLIMRADVTAAAASPGTAGPAAAQAQPSSEVDDSTGLRIVGTEKVTGMRKATAAAVSRSRREIPEATVWVDVDVTPLQELRADLAARDGTAPGLLAFASRFALAGLTRYPQLAQRFEEDAEGAQQIVSFDGINLGVAVQTDRGLVVPSVRGAHTMTTRQLQDELRRLTELARSGEATAQDLTGGTFTVNNYGVFGVDGSAAIIPQGQAAMLGMGRIVERGWGVDGELRLRQIMQLSLVFDHRICDGGTAGGFLRFVADCFEHPAGVLADL